MDITSARQLPTSAQICVNTVFFINISVMSHTDNKDAERFYIGLFKTIFKYVSNI